MKHPSDFAMHVTNFLSRHLPAERGARICTVIAYAKVFSLFLAFVNERFFLKAEAVTMDFVNKDIVLKFLEWLETNRNNGVSTRNQRLAALHSFFRYVQEVAPEHMLKCQEILAIHFKRTPPVRVGYLSREAIKAILAETDSSTREGLRDCAMLSLLYDSAARVQELADLKVRDLRTEYPATAILTGKGGKTRVVPLMKQTGALLGQYVSSYGLEAPEKLDWPLFSSSAHSSFRMFTRAGISYVLSKYVTMALPKCVELLDRNITPHIFRHSRAMHMLQAEISLVYIRDILGHVDLKTTEIYARADSEMKRKALEKAFNDNADNSQPVWQREGGLLEWLKHFDKHTDS